VRIRFGPFTMDSDTRQLFRGPEELHLSPKAFHLLETLIARRPAVVTKQDLFAHIWPGTFVAEANLNVLVGEVRRALADDARTPKFLRTVHGVGYAFCGDATPAGRPGSPAAVRPTRFWLEGNDRTYVLGEGDNIVGRDPSCTVWLNDSSVSRRHARIRIDGSDGTAIVDDLHSTNGTFVGGRRVEAQAPLADGQPVRVGSVELTFREGAERLAPTRKVRPGE
jgi:DNA-binding winged helix-turn-helix (wHTH) protein